MERCYFDCLHFFVYKFVTASRETGDSHHHKFLE